MSVVLTPELDEQPKEKEPLKVLLAEDNPTQRLVPAHLVRKAGYVVETVSDGNSALARILEETFDILVTDLDMPGLDGSGLCRRIREASLANYLYILMLTAHTGDADVAAHHATSSRISESQYSRTGPQRSGIGGAAA